VTGYARRRTGSTGDAGIRHWLGSGRDRWAPRKGHDLDELPDSAASFRTRATNECDRAYDVSHSQQRIVAIALAGQVRPSRSKQSRAACTVSALSENLGSAGLLCRGPWWMVLDDVGLTRFRAVAPVGLTLL
jgi:hypothetical protein